MDEMTHWEGDDAPRRDRPNRTALAAPAVNSAPRISQSTAIEQSRAVAEVQAAVIVAQNRPRDEAAALNRIRATCGQKIVAEKAFYRFPRSDKTVTGETIHLARELARCWTNLDYGIRELARDDMRGESEMLAVCWDLEANTRVTNTFIAPWRRDRKEGARALTELRDIYENNANLGARRLRECLFAVLPPYVIEVAKETCLKTLAGDGTVPLAQRVADAIAWFNDMGIIVDQLEAKLDRRTQRWTALDVAQLGVIGRSITRGEVTKEEEFPPARVTGAEILASAQPPTTTPGPAPAAAQPDDGGDIWPAVAPVPPTPQEEGK